MTITPNPAYSKYVAGGSEFSNVGVRAAAQFSFLDWYGPGGTRYQSWGGSGQEIGVGSVSVPAAPYTNFSNYYDGTGSCTTSDATPAASPTAAADVVNPVPSSTLSSATQAQLLQLAKSTAASLGESSPQNITVVPTTRYAANQLLGTTINNSSGKPDESGVYLVQATGNFTALRGAPGGTGPRPTGSALTLVVDPATNSILDLGISPNPITSTSLNALGATTSLSGSGAS